MILKLVIAILSLGLIFGFLLGLMSYPRIKEKLTKRKKELFGWCYRHELEEHYYKNYGYVIPTMLIRENLTNQEQIKVRITIEEI